MKLIKKGLKELAPIILLVAVVGIVLLSIVTYVGTHTSFLQYPIEGWLYSCGNFDFFYPLFISIPFAGSLYMKRKNRFIEYIGVRTDKEKYVEGQIKAGMIASFIVTYIIYFIPLLLSVYWMYYTKDSYSTDSGLENEMFGYMLVNHPVIFGMLWCAWKGLLASLLTRFGYYIAKYVDNIFVISLAPFIYTIADNFVVSNLGVPQLRFMTSFCFSSLDYMSPLTYVYGVIQFLIVTTIIIKVLKIKKDKQYEGV